MMKRLTAVFMPHDCTVSAVVGFVKLASSIATSDYFTWNTADWINVIKKKKKKMQHNSEAAINTFYILWRTYYKIKTKCVWWVNTL